MDFDPNAPAAPGAGLFGLPHGPDEALVHVLPVPFEATTSYRGGTARAPEAVSAASGQVDLLDLVTGEPWRAGIWMAPVDADVARWNDEARGLAAPVIERGGARAGDPDDTAAVEAVDAIGARLNAWVRERTAATLAEGKLPVLLGGDHATPYGAIAACAARRPGLGVLQFDAHADLRDAYEGFAWSHASIARNVLRDCDGVARLVQVGVRDLCDEERDAIEADDRVDALFDPRWAAARVDGGLRALVRETLRPLPRDVYVTFDVDGLDPTLCPSTGTPVPGGLLWHEAMLWLEELVESGRRIVGLDLVEVSAGPEGDPDGVSWDAIVGARLLYRLIGFALRSRGGR